MFLFTKKPPLMTNLVPPDLPPSYVYTRCYCEENIYLLCKEFLSRPEVVGEWEVRVLFISNESKTVALWEQKLAREEGMPVVWDYHVILVLKAKAKEDDVSSDSVHAHEDTQLGLTSWVYDFDSSITPVPCPWYDYFLRTFPYELNPQFKSMFRVIPGQVYLDYFASDRSHMLRANPEDGLLSYISPPPAYEPIYGELAMQRGIRSNLFSSFVCMYRTAETTYGDVKTIEEMISLLC